MLRLLCTRIVVGLLVFSIFAYSQITLTELPAYDTAPKCVQYCALNEYILGSESIGCGNTCCANDAGQSSTIANMISSCIMNDSECQDEAEAVSAMSLWGNFCSAVAAQQSPANTAATTTAGSSRVASSPASPGSTVATLITFPTPTKTLHPTTSTQSSASTESPQHPSSNTQLGLSTGQTVGLAIGTSLGGALLGAVLAIIATWWKPRQIGRFITCGRWPRKNETTADARRDMQQLPLVGNTINIFLAGSLRRSRYTDNVDLDGIPSARNAIDA